MIKMHNYKKYSCIKTTKNCKKKNVIYIKKIEICTLQTFEI